MLSVDEEGIERWCCRAAVAQILRLNGVPEVYDFSEPSLKAKRGKDSDAKTKGGSSRKAPG